QPSANIQRSIVFENIVSFERFEYDVGSITNGDYKVTLRVDDKKDKTRAWFDAKLDLSALPCGIYSINVHTISGNGIDDYGELADSFFRTLDVKSTYDGKNYSLRLNKEIRNRIELVIQ
ncbi:MAG: hypothetical protein PUF50_07710, partial [Erysipelotrichaceae bacterium]|nr:hypothetical protein [Erysipelotrichaceae bacterium]